MEIRKKAREFYQYALETQPQAKEAMWAEVFLVGLDVVLGKDEAAQSAMKELLTSFTDYEEMPGILAGKTNDCTSLAYDCMVKRKFKEARELCQYVSDNWPDNEATIDAQAGIANSNLALRETKAADAAIEKLLTQFSDSPRIAPSVSEIGFVCLSYRRYEKARELFECILDNWTDSEEVIHARAGLVRVSIAAGEDANARAEIDRLIADFANNPDLAMAVSLIAEGYWEQALQERREGLHDEAEVHFRKALGVWLRVIEELPETPHTTASYHFAGECYRVLEEDEKAIEYYQMVVDNWPDYESAWISQSLIGYLTKNLMKKGVIPKSEADVVIRDAFERVVKNYPDCGAANAARNWLKYNVKPKEGE